LNYAVNLQTAYRDIAIAELKLKSTHDNSASHLYYTYRK